MNKALGEVIYTGNRNIDFKAFCLQDKFTGWSEGDVKYAFNQAFPQYLDNRPEAIGVKKNQVARDVRVVLNKRWEENSLGDRYFKAEPELYIADESVYNDSRGDYVHVSSEHQTGMKEFITGVNSGHVYLHEINLKYPVHKI